MEVFTATGCGNVEETNSLLNCKQSFLIKDERGFTPLLSASNNKKLYREVYDAKKNLYGENLGEGESMSALHLACYARDRNFIRKLLEQGADINERIPETCPVRPGETPLQLCIGCRLENVARALVHEGADVNIVCPKGLRPIFMAENQGLRTLTPMMLRMYTSWTVNPVDKESGNSYLHLACKYGLVDVVESLLHHGADVNMQNDATPTQMGKVTRRRRTPLHMAMDTSVVKVLLRYGANLGLRDSFGDTPLHKAYHQHNYEPVKLMLEGHSQCQVNPVDASGFSHLHIACLMGCTAAVKSILKHNVVDINVALAREHGLGYAPLHLAVKCGSVEMVQLLLDHGASLEVSNSNGWAPLIVAVRRRDDTSIAKVLLDAGANVNTKGLPPLCGTPLHVAASLDRLNHVALLLERGANPNAINNLVSPLHLACITLNVEIVKLLLEHGADPNVKAEEHKTSPLHACVRQNNAANSDDDRHDRIISLLVEAGADLNACDSRSFRPIYVALKNKDKRPLQSLLFYGTDMQFDQMISQFLSIQNAHQHFSLKPFLEHLELLEYTKPSDETSHNNVLLERYHEPGIRNACRKEIEVLRKMGLDFCLTYSNIVKKNAVQVDRLWQRSKKLVELVESNELRRFPVYGDRLRRWYDDLQKAPSCLDQALVIVMNHWNLDQDSAETIFRFLNSKELETMIKAFEF